MLSAESAWRVLRAEHARIRELLGALDDALRADDWQRPGRALDALRAGLRRVQAFDDVTHQPKGVVLLSTLRSRSPQSDALLDTLERDRGQCDELLAAALRHLEALAGGTGGAPDEVRSLLGRHRRLMLRHMELEETLLHSHAAQLLTPAEWSIVVSSMSAVVGAAAQRERRRPG